MYNEYVKDTYNTSRLLHFENILKDNRFILSVFDNDNDSVKITNTDNKEMSNRRQIINESLFYKFIDDENKDDEIYNELNDSLKFLNMPNNNKDLLITYKNEILDNYKTADYLNIIRYFKSDEYIRQKVEQAAFSTPDVKTYNDIYHKITALRGLEELNNISNLNFDNTDQKKEFQCIEWGHLKNIFRTTKEQPKTIADFRPIYIQFIKNITSDNFIISKQITVNYVKKRVYSYNKPVLDHNMNLNKYTNPDRSKFKNEFCELLDITYSDQMPLTCENEQSYDNLNHGINKDVFDDSD